MSEQIAES